MCVDAELSSWKAMGLAVIHTDICEIHRARVSDTGPSAASQYASAFDLALAEIYEL